MNIEEAQSMTQSPYWDGFVKEIDRLIESESLKLRKCSADDLKGCQQVIETLEMIKRLPQNVIDRES